jgi:hypothetical protein
MYCDRHGRPDPNGDFQLINGKLIIRDGRYVASESMFMMDNKGSSATSLTDAERNYVATRAKAKHDQRYAYLAPDLRPSFSAEQRDEAIQAAAAAKKASAQHQQALSSSSEMERVRSEAQGGRVARKHLLANAWRR